MLESLGARSIFFQALASVRARVPLCVCVCVRARARACVSEPVRRGRACALVCIFEVEYEERVVTEGNPNGQGLGGAAYRTHAKQHGVMCDKCGHAENEVPPEECWSSRGRTVAACNTLLTCN
jgi:hypothetical protein